MRSGRIWCGGWAERMRDLLFLAHRIPYPPDKGEKIRAWNVLLHLARTHRIHLGCFVDDPDDWVHLPALRAVCADVMAIPLHRRWQKLKTLARARPGEPLSLGYFRSRRLQRWVAGKLAADIDRAFVYCSAMAPYLMGAPGVHAVLDMVDVDSEKWGEYAARSSWPARLVWAREGRTLLAFERRAAQAFDRVAFVSAEEARRFTALAPETAARVGWFDNGVDLGRFSPARRFDAPFPDAPLTGSGPHLVFTGTMDYWPNADAVLWFAAEVLPLLRTRHPGIVFHIVGAHPGEAVRRLAGPGADVTGIEVTGRVADPRPWVAHADAVVAPLRIARGIQNKVLEGMAMGRPVVATRQAFEGVRAIAGRDVLVADGAADMAARILEVLAGRHPELGANGRRAVEQGHAWDATLAPLAAMLAPSPRHTATEHAAKECAAEEYTL